MGINIDLKLDTRLRRKREDGTYPVVIYIYDTASKKAYYLDSTFHFTPEEFKSIWHTVRPRARYRADREKLKDLLEKAETDLEGTESFSMKDYKSKLGTPTTEQRNVYLYYKKRIDDFRNVKKSIGNASWYECSQKSLKTYQVHKNDNPDRLDLDRITPKWLEGYEQFMKDSGKSKTTVAMYLRALRAVLKAAIEAKALDPHNYPFGGKKYVLKEGGKVKKALDLEDIKTLYRSQSKTPEQDKAKDFWFFSYFSNGMNIKDILNLRHGQIGKDSFEYERIKTKETNRKGKIITVFLNDFTREVIRKYGNPSTGHPKQLVFPVLSDQNSPERNHTKTKVFTRFINQHIKKLAIADGITGEISTYFARHSYATGLQRNGTSIGFIQESLGHSSSKTTETYLAGFPNVEKKVVSEKLFQDIEN